MSKIWVHIRWFLIMIPLGLFSIAVTIFGVGFALVIGLIWGFSLFLWLWMAFALLGVPLAMLLEGKKFNPLWFLLDSSRFDSTRKSGYAKDFEQEFKGDKPTWFETWDWLSRRNRIWNFRNLKLFIPKQGKKIVYGVPKGQLYRNGKEVSVFEFAKWLWLRGNVGDWNTNNGDTINYEKSTIGYSSVYYKVGKRLYYRYSNAWQWRDYFLNFKFGVNNERYLLTFKVQKED